MNMSSQELLTLFLVLFLLVVIIYGVCKYIANNYIEKNRQSILEQTQPLSFKCINDGKKLLNEMKIYWSYIEQLGLNQEYSCSSSIVSNAANHEIKYLIKYSNISHDEYSLQRVDYCINWMHLYQQTSEDMKMLANNMESLLPMYIRIFISRSELPYKVCNVSYELTKYTIPEFVFDYTSPTGKSNRRLGIEITSDVLNVVKSELYEKISKAGFSKGQRSAMTNDLREAIKKRDNYTCCLCGNSVYVEPNLLLEVDHIIPVAKGGKTEAGNLQTLCWRCNRAKSDKVY